MGILNSVWLDDGTCMTVHVGTHREVLVMFRRPNGQHDPDWTLVPGAVCTSIPEITSNGKVALIDVLGPAPQITSVQDWWVPFRCVYDHGTKKFSTWKVLGPAFSRAWPLLPPLGP